MSPEFLQSSLSNGHSQSFKLTLGQFCRKSTIHCPGRPFSPGAFYLAFRRWSSAFMRPTSGPKPPKGRTPTVQPPHCLPDEMILPSSQASNSSKNGQSLTIAMHGPGMHFLKICRISPRESDGEAVFRRRHPLAPRKIMARFAELVFWNARFGRSSGLEHLSMIISSQLNANHFRFNFPEQRQKTSFSQSCFTSASPIIECKHYERYYRQTSTHLESCAS